MSYRPKDWVTGNGYLPTDDYSIGYEEGADSLLEGLKAEGIKTGEGTTWEEVREWLRSTLILPDTAFRQKQGTLVFIPSDEEQKHPYQGESID